MVRTYTLFAPIAYVAFVLWVCLLKGCSLQSDFDGYTFKDDQGPGAIDGADRDDPVDEADAAPWTAGKADAAMDSAHDAGTVQDASTAAPEASAPDARTPDAPDGAIGLYGTWDVTLTLVRSSCTIVPGTVTPVASTEASHWDVQPGDFVQRVRPTMDPWAWLENVYQGPDAPWSVKLTLEPAPPLRGTLTRDYAGPGPCAQTWTVAGVR